MLQGQDKKWLHYVKGIIAVDVYSAVFLASYLRYTAMNRAHISTLEVIDLQKYKVIKRPGKVINAIAKAVRTPFIFVVNKN